MSVYEELTVVDFNIFDAVGGRDGRSHLLGIVVTRGQQKFVLQLFAVVAETVFGRVRGVQILVYRYKSHPFNLTQVFKDRLFLRFSALLRVIDVRFLSLWFFSP